MQKFGFTQNAILSTQMKKNLIPVALFLPLFWGCQSAKTSTEKQKYLRWVGDIEQNEQIDEPGFRVCHGDDKVFQYFNLGKGPVYRGEKIKVLNTFKEKYKPVPGKNQDGLIRIRFVVNCQGKAGRFRLLQSGYDYQEKVFHKKITSQLLAITKEVEGWEVLYEDETPVDYYMYLIFKIKDGHLTEILP